MIHRKRNGKNDEKQFLQWMVVTAINNVRAKCEPWLYIGVVVTERASYCTTGMNLSSCCAIHIARHAKGAYRTPTLKGT